VLAEGRLEPAVDRLQVDAQAGQQLAVAGLGPRERSAAPTSGPRRASGSGRASTSQTLGAFGLAGRANDEIAATGARPRKVLQTGLDALTTSERRVGQLAAGGMTNKEIAQTLFVTIKTVEVHLSHAYRKLEISSRAQLQTALLTPAPNPASASA
jgi:DNA-binding CsgD family transcriptional regulator